MKQVFLSYSRLDSSIVQPYGGAMPLGFVLTVVIGAAISALHGLIILPIPIATSWLNYLHISSMWTVAAYVAFWREYQMRRSFAAELS